MSAFGFTAPPGSLPAAPFGPPPPVVHHHHPPSVSSLPTASDVQAQQGNSLHVTGVEGPLGVRINGVYARLENTTKTHSYTHASTSGVRAVYDKSAFMWRIFDGDVCVAHWTDSPPSASPESLHRFGAFQAHNKRYAAALGAFQAAAAAGHVPSYIKLFTYLSETRPGVALDACGAFAAAQSGAKHGCMNCMAALALCYLNGIGVEVNLSKANELVSQSMVSLCPMACYVQGMLHLGNGSSVMLKKRTAIPFLQIAASAEINASAAFNLAVLLSDAGDEFCDFPQAIRLLKFACAHGMQPAQDLLSRLDPQNSSPADSLPIQHSNDVVCSDAGQSASSQDEQSASSDAASPSEFFDPNICRSFCSSIFVRITEAEDVLQTEKDGSHVDNYKVSSNAKACLAPNLLVISNDGPCDGTVKLHFPKFDSSGAYVPAAPLLLPSSGSSHVMQYYAQSSRQCPSCSMYGPSPQTGERECTACRRCSVCCTRQPTCSATAAPAASGSFDSLFPNITNPFSGNASNVSNTFPVPDMFKLKRWTVSGGYVASQSLWRNGFPVYFQAPLPNQKEQFVIEFHMRPSMPSANSSARTPHSVFGVWELKSKDKTGSSECMYNLNTGCDNPLLTIAPVTLHGASEVSRCAAQIELACISATLSNTSAFLGSVFGPHFIAAYTLFCASEDQDKNVLRQVASVPKQISLPRPMKAKLAPSSGSGVSFPQSQADSATSNKDITDSAQKCVWINSKTGNLTLTISSIGVNASHPMSICVQNCKGPNAVFVNGRYSFQNALKAATGDLLLVYQSALFGTILGCLVQKNRVSCAISASAIKVYLQSKDLSSFQPFAFPREWILLPTKVPPQPAPTRHDETPRHHMAGGGFGLPPPHGLFAAPAQLRPFGQPQQPQLQQQAFGMPASGAAQASTTAALPNGSSSEEKDQDASHFAEMTISTVESTNPSDHDLSNPIWPSLSVLADVLKKSSTVKKKPLLSHIWRHLVLRCGSPAAALTDFGLIFHLSSESAINLMDVEEFSDYLSTTLDATLADYIGVISSVSSEVDCGSISLAVPLPVASFLSTHCKSSLNAHLRKMYHAIVDALALRSVDSSTRGSCSKGQISMETCIEVATVIGASFGLDAAETLLAANPFNSDAICLSIDPCCWDTSFCSGPNQNGWHGSPFYFTGTTGVQFPSGPIHCPTVEKFGAGHTRKGYLNFNYNMHSNDAWSVGLVPVSSLRDSSYLWSSVVPAIGYHFSGGGARLRPFPAHVRSGGVTNVFVGVDADAGTCSFYCNGRLISTDQVPQTMFPCVIAICGHSGSSFSMSAADVPDEFRLSVASSVPPPSESLDSDRQASIFNSALSSLFAAVLNGTVGHCHKIMLDCALRSLFGAHDHKILKEAFHDAKGTRSIFKMSCPAKVAAALDRSTSQCFERLCRSDPDFSSCTVSGLLSFIIKVQQDEFLNKISADSKLMHIVFLSVSHRILKKKLDATEFVSFVLDLDTSIPLSADYFNSLARALLPFFQTDDGTVAAGILLDAIAETNSCSAHVESLFNALVIQLTTLPHHIGGSVPLLDTNTDSSCALVDIYGSHLASLSFKCTVSQNFNQHHHYVRPGYKVFVEVQVGSEKPTTHVIFSDIATLPSSLGVSIVVQKQGIFVFVESVPICIIDASIDLVCFSRFLCSDSISFKVQHEKPSPSAFQLPSWLLLFLKSKLHQRALDSSPTSQSSVSKITADHMSFVLDKVLPANQNVGWSTILQHAMLSELVDLKDESSSRDVVCGALDSFIEACRPFLSGSNHLIGDQERTPRSPASTRVPFIDFCSAKTDDMNCEDPVESPITKNYMRFVNSVSMVASKDLATKSFCSSLLPADIQFRSTSNSQLTADQQASNIVQIVYKQSPMNFDPHSASVSSIATIRKISSHPILLASFSAVVRVKDLNPSVVACVDLSLFKPGSKNRSRTCSFQLYSCGLILHDGICVGYLPQFAKKQPVTISVLQMGIVSFVVDHKVVFEFNIELSSGTVGQLAVSCCGEGDSSIGPPIAAAESKELFSIELYQSPASSSNYPFTIIQKAMRNHFSSLPDLLHFASFAYSLSSIVSPSVVKRSGNGLSLIQRSADKTVFDLLCVDGLASISCVSDESCLIHASRIICDWLPEHPNLYEIPSLCLFKRIQPGSSAFRVFASVVRSQLQSKPALPAWCLSAVSCVLCESFSLSEFGNSDNIFTLLRSHISQNFDEWSLHLPPSDARAMICNHKREVHIPASAGGCGPECNASHSGQGNCLLCGRNWGQHGGHRCFDGRRGSWKIEPAGFQPAIKPLNFDSLPTEHACTCSVTKNPETGLDDFLFNTGRKQQSAGRITSLSSEAGNESEEQREFREFQEWKLFKARQSVLASRTSNRSGASVADKKRDQQCPVCFDRGSAVFGCSESFGIFPGSTVVLQTTHSSTSDQSSFTRILHPDQTGFVVCTYQSLALVQGPVTSGIIPCEMLQLVSCGISTLFFELPSVHTLSESVFFADVMSSVAKFVTTYNPSLQRSFSTSALSLTETFFSAFGPDYCGPFEFPLQERSSLLFLSRSASLLSCSFGHVLESRFPSVDDLTKMLRFLNTFGSVDWEDAVPGFNFLANSSGIFEISRQSQQHFFALLFPGKKDPSISNEAVMLKLISSLSTSDVSYLAHVMKHSSLSCNFFIPFSQYFATSIASGQIFNDKSRLVLLFLQQSIPPGAFLELRHALLQLSSSFPVQSLQSIFSRDLKKVQVTKIQRRMIDFLVPHLGATCAMNIDGRIQSILPHCGWCDITLPGRSPIRLSLADGLVLDAVYSAKTPKSLTEIFANLPLQECFVVEALRSLLSKQLISTTGSSSEEFMMSSQLPHESTNTVAVQPYFHSMGNTYCEAVHAVFACLKQTLCMPEHELFRELCGDSLEVKRGFSASLVAFALSKMLASGQIIRRGHFLSLAGSSQNSTQSSFEPREFQLSVSSCIRSIVVVVCDDFSSTPQLSPYSAGICESFAYDNAISLVRESFTRIHQDTGIDISEISGCFEKCKGNFVKTIHTLMFDPKFSAKLTVLDSSSVSTAAGRIQYVGEGFCQTCISDKVLVALPCDHRYCQECLQEYIQDSMANSSTPKAAGGADRAGGRLVTNICCPAHVEGCSYIISTTDVKFLATSEYSSFVDLICRQSTRAMASGAFPTVTCSCGRLIVGQTSESEYECSCGQIATIGDVKNSVVVQNWIAHPFSSCLQEERWKEFTQVGSEARQSLMRTKKCPSCGTTTTKCGCQGVVICNQMDKCPNEACDHMQCGVCRSHWCWVCGRLGSTESRCTYPAHLISQTKELFKEAEVKVKEMEKDFFKNSWRVIKFDDSFNTATVHSVMPTTLPFSSLKQGDRFISINGQPVDSAESATKALSCAWTPGHFLRVVYQRDGISKLLVCQAPSDIILEQDAFVMRRSRIVQSVSEISESAAPDSDLEKNRTLLDKIISSIFIEPDIAPNVSPVHTQHGGFGGFGAVQHGGLGGFGASHSPMSLIPKTAVNLQPCRSDGRDVFTNAVLDPRVKHFLQVAGSTSDAHMPQIITELVDAQKSLLKIESGFGMGGSTVPLHSAHFFSHEHSPASADSKSTSLIIKRVARSNLRVRQNRSLLSPQVGLLQAGAVFAFSEIDGEWAKLSHLHNLDLQSTFSCDPSVFIPHDPVTEGYCITDMPDHGATLEEPSDHERATILAKFSMPDFAVPKKSPINSNTVACYIWKSWAFVASLSPKGYFNRVTFWCHNGAIQQAKEPKAIETMFGKVQVAATSAVEESSKAAAGVTIEPCKITRALERCGTFGGSVAILDQEQEAWLFDCPEKLTPIDSSSASRGCSIQIRPWQLNLKPTVCESLAEFCTHLLASSASPFLDTPKNTSVMHSVELDALLHCCGNICVVMYGNGSWATCHSSHIPSSFKDATHAPLPANPFSAGGIPDFSRTSLPHVGSWDGCGGNMLGTSGCAGDGNCSARCVNCGARSHWTCCGSSDKSSTTCVGPITSPQAKENDRLFRLVVREAPIPCRKIAGIFGGAFSALSNTDMPFVLGGSAAAVPSTRSGAQ